jgi:hypothetical protein
MAASVNMIFSVLFLFLLKPIFSPKLSMNTSIIECEIALLQKDQLPHTAYILTYILIEFLLQMCSYFKNIYIFLIFDFFLHLHLYRI